MAIVITGTSITAPDGAIDAADLTGALPAIDGAALTGVGGATSLVTDWTDITDGTAALTINFTDSFDVYYIQFEDLKVNGTSSTLILVARFTDSSDTAVSTGSVYKSAQSFKTTQNNSAVDQLIVIDQVYGQQYSTASYRSNLTAAMAVYNPKSSTAKTRFTGWALNNIVTGTTFTNRRFEGFLDSASKVNNGIVLYEYFGEAFASGKYRVYGVDL